MIIVWGAVEAKPEFRLEIQRLGLEHVQRSRLEPGCITHSIQIDVENENRFIFYEEWLDMEALQVHFSVPASGQFVKAISKLAMATPDMKMFQATPP
ncbi:MAG: quinol monooxygenase YgiN [Candidatus Azotimanducaceae bacterium]|jgi:quinol monooxygenase YgiN